MQEVDGSSPFVPTMFGDMAQLVARLNGIQKVTSSNPVISTTKTAPFSGCCFCDMEFGVQTLFARGTTFIVHCRWLAFL